MKPNTRLNNGAHEILSNFDTFFSESRIEDAFDH